MSLLTIVTQACDRIGLTRPTSAFLSSDQQVLQLVGLAQQEGKDLAGYALLKVWTVQRPTLPTANASIIQIDPEYVIHRAAAMALRARGDKRADRRAADYQQADVYDQIASQKRLSVQVPDGVRWLAN